MTDYSEIVPGAIGNFHQAVRFDQMDGYIGITQYDGTEGNPRSVKARVLLTRAQMAALLRFLKIKPQRGQQP